MTGRKSKLTPELIKEAKKLVKGGNYTDVVCRYLGIHPSTWYKWLQEGEKARSGLKREFFDTIKKAEAEAEIRNVQVMQKAAQEGTWHAAATFLERKYPDRWGRKDRVSANVEHTGKEGGPIQHEQTINLENLTYEELTLLESLLAKSEKKDK